MSAATSSSDEARRRREAGNGARVIEELEVVCGGPSTPGDGPFLVTQERVDGGDAALPPAAPKEPGGELDKSAGTAWLHPVVSGACGGGVARRVSLDVDRESKLASGRGSSGKRALSSNLDDASRRRYAGRGAGTNGIASTLNNGSSVGLLESEGGSSLRSSIPEGNRGKDKSYLSLSSAVAQSCVSLGEEEEEDSSSSGEDDELVKTKPMLRKSIKTVPSEPQRRLSGIKRKKAAERTRSRESLPDDDSSEPSEPPKRPIPKAASQSSHRDRILRNVGSTKTTASARSAGGGGLTGSPAQSGLLCPFECVAVLSSGDERDDDSECTSVSTKQHSVTLVAKRNAGRSVSDDVSVLTRVSESSFGRRHIRACSVQGLPPDDAERKASIGQGVSRAGCQAVVVEGVARGFRMPRLALKKAQSEAERLNACRMASAAYMSPTGSSQPLSPATMMQRCRHSARSIVSSGFDSVRQYDTPDVEPTSPALGGFVSSPPFSRRRNTLLDQSNDDDMSSDASDVSNEDSRDTNDRTACMETPELAVTAGKMRKFGGGFMEAPSDSVDPVALIQECADHQNTTLDLYDLRLQDVPNTIFSDCSHLTCLDLSGNAITSLPPSICTLMFLQKLSVKSNNLTCLPEELGDCSELSELYLDQNSLSSLPDALSNCTKLATVALDYNCITDFPKCLSEIEHLETVYLVENPNVSLPTPAKCARWKKVSITVDNSPELVEQAELLASETQGRVTVQWNQIFPSKVLPGVYLGSVRSAQDPRIYKHLNITNLASIGRELSVVLAKGMRHMQSNVDDLSNTDITTEFDTVHSFIDEARKAEEGVLVHCFKGQSRSATLVITYLMRTFSLTLDEAFKFVQDRRPLINPNPGFMQLMRNYEQKMDYSSRSANDNVLSELYAL